MMNYYYCCSTSRKRIRSLFLRPCKRSKKVQFNFYIFIFIGLYINMIIFCTKRKMVQNWCYWDSYRCYWRCSKNASPKSASANIKLSSGCLASTKTGLLLINTFRLVLALVLFTSLPASLVVFLPTQSLLIPLIIVPVRYFFFFLNQNFEEANFYFFCWRTSKYQKKPFNVDMSKSLS